MFCYALRSRVLTSVINWLDDQVVRQHAREHGLQDKRPRERATYGCERLLSADVSLVSERSA